MRKAVWKMLLASSSFALATGAYAATTDNNFSNGPTYFLLLGTGYSSSMGADINANPNTWDASPQGYNAPVGHSAFYTAGIGVQVSPLLSFDIEGTTAPSYSYEKFQTSSASGTIGYLGNKTRYFDLSNSNVMVDGYLHGQGLSNKLYYQSNNFIIQPIIGAGLGISYNTVKDFHSVTQAGQSGSVMEPNTISSFAWQASAGLELDYGPNLAMDLGYRYFDGGKFESNNYAVSPNSDGSPNANLPPWTGKLKTNEFFVSLIYKM